MNKAANYFINPLLFSIYPVIFTYTHNVEKLRLNQLVMPFFFAIVLSLGVYLIFKILFKKNIIASISAVVFLLLFWNYGLICQVFNHFFSIKHLYVLLIIIFLYALFLYFLIVIDKRVNLKNISRMLAAAGAFLIIFNLFYMIPGEFEKYRIVSSITYNHLSYDNDIQADNYPDIYLLIFDEYARLDTGYEALGYDNSHFKRFLKDKGFFIAENSVVKTIWTSRLLPERLNLRYLNGSETETERMALYNKNFLFFYLDKKGYEITFLDGWIHQLSPGHADGERNIKRLTYRDMYEEGVDKALFLDNFSELLYLRSLLNPLGTAKESIDYYAGNSGFFEFLKNFENSSGTPQFVYAHIMCPHWPYIFDRDGNPSENPTSIDMLRTLDPDEVKMMYIEQYIYVTGVMKEIIEAIQSKDPDSVIVIQSDHGYRNREVGFGHSYKVFNTVYFPDGDYAGLHNDISPVNTLRVLFNKYFNKNYDMLD